MNLQEVAVFTVNDVLKHARIMRDCQAACGEIAIRLFQMFGTKVSSERALLRCSATTKACM